MSDFDHRVVLGLPIEHATVSTVTVSSTVSIEELARALGGEHAAIRTGDALAALEQAGLAHLVDRLAWPSPAALRSAELAPI